MAVTLNRAIETEEILTALTRYGFTQADLAHAIGVSDRSVRSWRKGAPVRRPHEARLFELRDIVLVLEDSLTPRGVGQWFRAHNRPLNRRRPLDVFADGDVVAVRAAAEAFAEGVYL